MKQVAAGIVLYRSERCITRALDSLAAQTLKPGCVVVVDNASPDASVDLAEAHPLKPVVIRNSTNVGFARAQNQAVRLTESDYYLAMNPDLYLANDFLERMVDAVERDPKVGWAQGKILFTEPDGAPTNTIYTTGHIMKADFTVTNRAYGCDDNGDYDTPGVVFGANGAAAFYRRRMMEEIAVAGEFYDEQFFLYWDDVDVDVRANALGWKCLYAPQARGYHVSVGSGGFSTDRVRVEFRKNRILSILKNHGAGGLARAWGAGFPRNLFQFAVESVFRPDIYFRYVAGVLREIGKSLEKGRKARDKLAGGPR